MKKYLFTIIPFALGVVCFIAYSIIGCEVAPDGTLNEPFALIPIGMISIATALIIGVVQSAWALFHNATKVDKWMFGISLTLIILISCYLASAFSHLHYLDQKEISMITTNITK